MTKGQQLKQFRESKEISQRRLAKILFTNSCYLYQMERDLRPISEDVEMYLERIYGFRFKEKRRAAKKVQKR